LLGVLLAGPLAADDWPQWMGEKRDGVWRETGILERFPQGGPQVRWSHKIGGGHAAPSVAAGRVYVFDFIPSGDNPPRDKTQPFSHSRRGERRGKERLLCLRETDGTVLWTYTYSVLYTHAAAYANGPRSAPLVDRDHVYVFGAEGDISCVRTRDGEKIWRKHVKKDYRIQTPTWGFAAHPVIHGEHLINVIGGKGSAVVAFDKRTGKEAWRALDCRSPGYSQLAVHSLGGIPYVLAWHGEGLNALNPETGEVYWTHRARARHGMAIGMPRLDGTTLYMMSWSCSRALELATDPPGVKLLWKADRRLGVGGKLCVPFIQDGHIYGTDEDGTLRCVELATGKRIWESRGIYGKDKVWMGSAFIVKQQDRFFICSERGDLIMARLSPKGYHEIDRARIIDRSTGTGGRPIWWSHPAFANRSIYVRNDNVIKCLSLAAPEGKP
jgi:outer membrane protein assembly factor BamB